MTLEFCSLPRTSKEIFDMLEVTYHSRNIKLYITALVKQKLLIRTNPDNPKDKNQKYITTEAGKLYVEENDNRRKTR